MISDSERRIACGREKVTLKPARMVEQARIELAASALRTRRSFLANQLLGRFGLVRVALNSVATCE